MANTVPGSTLGSPTTGGTNTQGLADWAAPYVTGYLGEAQALAQKPYEVYQGPLTAGESALQKNVFQGLAGLSVPSNLGQSFSSTGAYAPPPAYGTQPGGAAMPPYAMGQGVNQAPKTEDDWNRFQSLASFAPGSDMAAEKAKFLAGNAGSNMSMAPMGGTPMSAGSTAPQQNIAQQYMNPYLQAVLNPQLAELRRQNDITNMNTNAKLTSQGAFGGGRQAIMNAENNRNLMQEMNKTVGQGYASAYDKAMNQFNTEQGQSKDLVNLLSTAGAQQRGIESEGVAADKAEFEAQRQYPYQQVQFQRDMISGLPTSSVTNTPGQLSGVGQLLSVLGGGTAAAEAFGYKNVGELLGALGLKP